MAGSGIREKLGVDEITRGIWKALLAEFLGTLLLNFFGCASCISIGGTAKNPLMISLAFGLVIMAVVQVRKLDGHRIQEAKHLPIGVIEQRCHLDQMSVLSLRRTITSTECVCNSH